MTLAAVSILFFVLIALVAWFVIAGLPKKKAWQPDEHRNHSVGN